ncbi:MAG: sigma-70 family RNA polymerase sigma factor [Acidobacteria bacterium]|nr:sigma-70 family RNA polymerase sigma factor [Acidobacteriota bacterium]
MATTSHEVTQLLADWSNGDQLALDQLMRLVEGELRQMAHRYMARQNPGHTLQTTALINEAFIKMVGQQDKHFQNREHFFGVAASAMRHILVDYARSKQYSKRGGGAPVVSLDEALTVSEERAAELVALDDALKELANFDARKAQVVELRFFGGLSVEETAKVLNVSEITVIRDWNFSKSWLHRELSHTQAE